ncbi:hypothetical protein llap_7073 [Limosa lapponica baueri]|uniref:Uncharacterized protein n=1 Tax=Limosa lapponica baueri TaxID=1758121 RepID=A0A2I0U9A1_LIMLA|nr:hypothetical protein llap_7073 [Limosa lapponica baueri]
MCRTFGEPGGEDGVCVETQVGNEKSSGNGLPQGSLAGKSFESAEMKGFDVGKESTLYNKPCEQSLEGDMKIGDNPDRDLTWKILSPEQNYCQGPDYSNGLWSCFSPSLGAWLPLLKVSSDLV